MENFEQYLQPSELYDFDNESVKEKALVITKDLKSDEEKTVALFYWVRDEIKYTMGLYKPNIKDNFKASVTLRRKIGFCVSKSILLSTLARAVGIPARIHLVDLINHKISQKVVDRMGTNIMHFHGFSELFLHDKWIKLTPSFDKETAIKGGFLPMCEFDGTHDSVFPPFDSDGNRFGEYLIDRGTTADLPLDEIDRVFKEKYPHLSSEEIGVRTWKIEDN